MWKDTGSRIRRRELLDTVLCVLDIVIDVVVDVAVDVVVNAAKDVDKDSDDDDNDRRDCCQRERPAVRDSLPHGPSPLRRRRH